MSRKVIVICTAILFGTLFTSCSQDDDLNELIELSTSAEDTRGDDQTQTDPCKGNCDD